MGKLSDFFSYKPLSKYEGLYGTIKCRAPTTYVGVELELEQVKYKQNANLPTAFTTHEDGSLKLNGREFVTRPIRFCYLEQELKRLFNALDKPLLSSRCSTHIHLNVRDFTKEELLKFTILYMVFEKCLFTYANPTKDRWNNIFCTPLYQFPGTVALNLSRINQNRLDSLCWNKYYALNLCPIYGGESKKIFGTIEFRHMEGSTDVDRIVNWINLIVSLKISAKKLSLTELYHKVETMNTDSSYYQLAEEIFQSWAPLILNQPNFKFNLETCITMTKSTLLQAGLLKANINENIIIGDLPCAA